VKYGVNNLVLSSTAVWMLPADDTYGEWPASGEVDIVAAVGEYIECGVIDQSTVRWNVQTRSLLHVFVGQLIEVTGKNDVCRRKEST